MVWSRDDDTIEIFSVQKSSIVAELLGLTFNPGGGIFAVRLMNVADRHHFTVAMLQKCAQHLITSIADPDTAEPDAIVRSENTIRTGGRSRCSGGKSRLVKDATADAGHWPSPVPNRDLFQSNSTEDSRRLFLGFCQMFVEPVGENGEIFEQVRPSVCLTLFGDEFTRDSGTFEFFEENFSLLDRHQLVCISVNDQRRSVINGDVIDW